MVCPLVIPLVIAFSTAPGSGPGSVMSAPAPGMQEQSRAPISYSAVELSLSTYVDAVYEQDATAASVSVEWGEHAFAGVAVVSSKSDPLVNAGPLPIPGTQSQDHVELGAGVHFEPLSAVSVYSTAAFGVGAVHAEPDGLSRYKSADAETFRYAIGVRVRPMDQLEGFLELARHHWSYDSVLLGPDGSTSDSVLTLGTRIYTTDSLAVRLAWATGLTGDTEIDQATLGLSLFF